MDRPILIEWTSLLFHLHLAGPCLGASPCSMSSNIEQEMLSYGYVSAMYIYIYMYKCVYLHTDIYTHKCLDVVREAPDGVASWKKDTHWLELRRKGGVELIDSQVSLRIVQKSKSESCLYLRLFDSLSIRHFVLAGVEKHQVHVETFADKETGTEATVCRSPHHILRKYRQADKQTDRRRDERSLS